MASVITFPAGRSFVFTVNKRLEANPNKRWNNSYEAVSIGSGGLSDLVALGRAIVAYERYFHTEDARFVDWEVRTGARDSNPYNPESFYQEPINLLGRVTTRGANLLDLSVALWVNRAVLTGRLGNLYYRGMLAEADVVGSSGTFSLNDGGYWGSLLETAQSYIFDYLSQGTNAVLKLVMIGPNGEYPRPIARFDVNGVTIAKKLRRYFDRGAAQGDPPEYLTIVPADVVSQAGASVGVVSAPPSDLPVAEPDPPPGA